MLICYKKDIKNTEFVKLNKQITAGAEPEPCY